MSKRPPSQSASPADDPPRTGLPLRLAITLLAPCSLLLLHHIGLPGVDTSALPAHLAASPEAFSAFGLGIMPFLVSACIVELVAALVPRWSPLRHGGPEGRASLARAAAVLGVAIAVFQASGMATLLSSTTIADVVGHPQEWLVVLTLTAGSSCLAVLATLLGTRALAGGFALLAAGAPLVVAAANLARRPIAPTPVQLAVLAIEAALVVAATALVLRSPRAAAMPAREPTYRTIEKTTPPRASIPAPASGLLPLPLIAPLLALPATLQKLFAPTAHVDATPSLDAILVPLAATLLVVLTLAFGWLFNRPTRLAALRSHGPSARPDDELLAEARADLAPALARTILFIGALFFLRRLAHQLDAELLEPTTLALAAALGIDVVAELRARRRSPDLVSIWPEHRPYAIALAREALAAADIPFHARGEGVRRMLQLLGPYVPIELMVPRDDAARATKILAELLLPRSEDARFSTLRGDRPRATAEIAAALRGGRGVALALLVAGLAGLALVPSSRPGAAQPARARHVAVELLVVDDDLAVSEYATGPLPQGASLQTVALRTGPEHVLAQPYVRLVRGAGESLAQARARLEAWTSRLTLPAGERVIFGKVLEIDDDRDPPEVAEIGWRTYVVKGSAEITGADVIAAEAAPDDRSAHVSIDLTPAAGSRFAALTKAILQRRLAIVVDGEVRSAPMITQEIAGGHLRISMGAGSPERQLEEAKQLAAALRGE